MSNKSTAEFERITPDQIAHVRQFQAAIMCDVPGRSGRMIARIRTLRPAATGCGPAFAVEVRPGDNLMRHVALAVAKPGEVIVVDGKSDETHALFRDLMITQAEATKLGDFVVNAASRDTASPTAASCAIYAASTTPCRPTKGLPGRLTTPVSVEGVAVSPWDLVIGDVDGAVIPRDEVEAVLDAAQKKVGAKQQRLLEIEEGLLVSPRPNDALRRTGLPAL